MKKKIPILIILLQLVQFVQAQNIGHYPDFYNFYFSNPYEINPSWIPDSIIVDINLFKKNLTGDFKDITSTQLNLSYVGNTKNFKHLFRGVINEEQEGPYIKSPQFIFNYANGVKISNKLTIYSAGSLGASGVYLSAPSSNYSFYMPDGNIGLTVKYNKLILGVVTKQIFNNSRYNFYLKRFYQSNINYSKLINWRWEINLGLNSNYFLDSKHEHRIHVSTVYQRKFEFGLVNKNLNSLSFYSKLKIPIYTNCGQLKVGFMYTNLFSSKNNLPNSFELFLGFQK